MGLAAAFEIARRGARVTVLERDIVGRHASTLNAGGVRRVNRHVAELALAHQALALWPDLSERLGADVRFQRSGHLLVAEDEAELARLAARVGEANASGHAHERLIERAEAREIAPALADHVVGGLWGEGDGHADPRATLEAYRSAAEGVGATILEGTTLRSLSRADGAWIAATSAGRLAAPVLLNCAGAWGGRVAAMAGDPLPVEPRAPMAMLVAPRPRFLGPVIQTLTRRLTLKQREDGAVAIGGGHRARLDGAGWPAIVPAEAEANLATAVSLFPAHLAGARPARVWAGVEGYAPDNVAILGPSGRQEALIHAFAFSGHGFALVPAVGQAIAILAGGHPLSTDICSLSPERFARA
jgi:sarcosine oxidase subunit beta